MFLFRRTISSDCREYTFGVRFLHERYNLQAYIPKLHSVLLVNARNRIASLKLHARHRFPLDHNHVYLNYTPHRLSAIDNN